MATREMARGTRPAAPAPSARPRLYLASFESRIAAAFIDLIVLFIIAALLVTAGSLVILVSSDFERVDPSPAALVAFWVAVVSIPLWQMLYLFVCWAWRGQTVGAAVMQVVVLRSDGRPLGMLGATARILAVLTYVVVVGLAVLAAFLLRAETWQAAVAVGAALLILVLGLLWAVLDRYRRTLHDRLAGTIVVRTA